jgi:hypothetical protein
MKLYFILVFVSLVNMGWSQKKIIERKEVRIIEKRVNTENKNDSVLIQSISDPISLELEVNELLNGENVDIRITEINGEKEIFISSVTNGINSQGAYIGEAAAEVQKIIDSRAVPYNQTPKLDAPNQKIKIKQKFKSN